MTEFDRHLVAGLYADDLALMRRAAMLIEAKWPWEEALEQAARDLQCGPADRAEAAMRRIERRNGTVSADVVRRLAA